MSKKIIKKSIYNIKIILLGESGVGKTNLINAYFGNDFKSDVLTTANPSQSHDKIEIKNNICYIDVWDTMGHEQYRSVTKSFIKGSHIIIFVYDITDKKSFKELEYWVNKVNEEIDNNKIIKGLAANKIDLFEKGQVSKNEGEDYGKKIGAYFCETSAKEDRKGFKKFVIKLVEKLFINEDNIEKEGNIIEKRNETIQIKEKKEEEKKVEKKKSNCC